MRFTVPLPPETGDEAADLAELVRPQAAAPMLFDLEFLAAAVDKAMADQ